MALLEIFNFLHFIGLAFGVGGATIAAVISAKSEKDEDVGAASMKIMPAISKLIWLGMILLIISGIVITPLVTWPLNTQNLLLKHVLVVWIVIIGVLIGFKSRKLQKLAPKKGSKPSWEFLQNKKQMKIYGVINLVLWYLVSFLSVFV
ncbi:MAG: DUF2269 family protein [Nanoarchaeota archaeon]|nr:DUF2269 family protein [Nanoarchaeota archaeon]